MAELNPPLGTTTPEIFLDNVKRADKLVNGPAGTVNDRAGEPLDTWRQMMAKNDEVRQNIIPLGNTHTIEKHSQPTPCHLTPVGKMSWGAWNFFSWRGFFIVEFSFARVAGNHFEVGRFRASSCHRNLPEKNFSFRGCAQKGLAAVIWVRGSELLTRPSDENRYHFHDNDFKCNQF